MATRDELLRNCFQTFFLTKTLLFYVSIMNNKIGAFKQKKQIKNESCLLTQQMAHGKYCHCTKPEPVHLGNLK